MAVYNRNIWSLCLIFIVLLRDVIQCSPVYHNVGISNTGPKLHIRNSPCVSSKTGETGICMFALTCANANGTILGVCLDRFYFGTCCKVTVESNEIPNDEGKHKYKPLKPTASEEEELIQNEIIRKLSNITRQAINSMSPKPTTEHFQNFVDQFTSSTTTVTNEIRTEGVLIPSNNTLILEEPNRNIERLTTPNPYTISISSVFSSTLPSVSDSTIPVNSSNEITFAPLPPSPSTHSNEVNVIFEPITTIQTPTVSVLETSGIDLNLIRIQNFTSEEFVTETTFTESTYSVEIVADEMTTPKTIITRPFELESSVTNVTSPLITLTEIFTETSGETSTQTSTETLKETSKETSSETSIGTLAEISPGTSSYTTEISASTTSNNLFNNFWQQAPVSTTSRPTTTTTTSSLFGSIFNNFWDAIYSDYSDDDGDTNKDDDEKETLESIYGPQNTTTNNVATPTASPQGSTSVTTANNVQPVTEKLTSISTTSTTERVLTTMPTTTNTPTTQKIITSTASTTVIPTTEKIISTTASTTVIPTTEKIISTTESTTVIPTTEKIISTTESTTVIPTTEKTISTTESTTVIPTTEKLVWTTASTTVIPITEKLVWTTESTTVIPTTEKIVSTTASTMMESLTTIASISTSTKFGEEEFNSLNMSNYKEVCGRRVFPESRIVGGVDSSFAKWPWQTSLMRWIRSKYRHKCGAALLTENWAITAAHCTYQIPPSELLLRFGQTDFDSEEEPYPFFESRVQLVATHNDFNPVTFEYDIAMLRLYSPIEPFRPNILPVCVTDDDNDYIGTLAHVTGWGRIYDGGPLAAVLQDVQVPVISNQECMDMYKTAGYRDNIEKIFLCAAWIDGNYDSCEGDSGGPLVVQRDSDGRWILIGIISWGRGCAEPNKPGVYTRISEFREWINTILKY